MKDPYSPLSTAKISLLRIKARPSLMVRRAVQLEGHGMPCPYRLPGDKQIPRQLCPNALPLRIASRGRTRQRQAREARHSPARPGRDRLARDGAPQLAMQPDHSLKNL